ncbi:MAG: ABC transporter substrate binding protein [Gammaproteobacteria bacterium]
MARNHALRLISLIIFIVMSRLSVAAPVTIGIVTDGTLKRPVVPTDVLVNEITELTRGEFDVQLPSDKILDGAWTVDGVRGALRQLLSDQDVDIVIALGLVASHEASQIENLRKPMIAPIVADARLQGFPIDGDSSGRRNFVYIASFHRVEDEIETFRDIVDFQHLAVVINSLSVESIPAIGAKAREIAENSGLKITSVAARQSVDEALAAIPADVDAVYITPQLQWSDADFERMAQGLIDRKLPSFSLLGRSEVEKGVLLASGGLPADQTRFARRIALNIQSILLGSDAGTLSVSFPTSERLIVNMRTAKAIGFYPRWAILIDAETLFDDELESGAPLTLVGAMKMAVEANLDVQTAGAAVAVVGEDVYRARSPLLPQVGIAAGFSQIDRDSANNLFSPEKTSDADLFASQLVYSDDAWAAYKISQYLKTAADHEYETLVFDILQSSASSYLSFLRTKALEGVQISNLEVTRVNLDLARRREAVGFSGRDEVLRWESQIATDRQNLLAAQADRRQVAIEVNRVLHRPQPEPFTTPESDVDKLITLINEPDFQRFVDNPGVWPAFQNFMVASALEAAPELKGLDALIVAQEREIKRAQRSYYVPDVFLDGNARNNLNRSGAGTPSLFLQDETWRFSLQATLPLFEGGNRRAELSQGRHQLRQLQLEQDATAERVEARTRAALFQVGGSYPAIELSRDSADAARENLELITDKYVRGAVSVTDLIDAQDAALAAELAAAEAEYSFLIDLVEVLRAGSDFSLFLDPGYSPEWYNQIETYFREHNEKVPTR